MPFTLIFYVVLIVGVGAVLGGIHHSIYSSGSVDGAKKQLAADTPVLNKALAERDESRKAQAARESEAATCKLAADAQSSALLDMKATADVAKDTARKALAQLEASRHDADAHTADMRRRAALPPQGDHNAQCVAAESVLRDTAIRLRQQP